MRKIILFISLWAPSIGGLTAQPFTDQNRHNIWAFGSDADTIPGIRRMMLMDYNQIPPSISVVSTEASMSVTSSSICDTAGNLLFYTNGHRVFDATHHAMPNGDYLNPSNGNNPPYPSGMIFPLGVLILEDPGDSNVYWLLHSRNEAYNNWGYMADKLYYSKVDMRLNGGMGDVTEKNVLLLRDTLAQGLISATRHANGRDWWILVPKDIGNTYFRFLLSPNGIDTLPPQDIGTEVILQTSLGQVVFSPDGTKYCRGASHNAQGLALFLYGFDRCTGLLHSPQHALLPDTTLSAGVAISPNSRYLYVSSALRLYQFDLSAPDAIATLDTVGIFDWFIYQGRHTVFFNMQLMPDDEILVGAGGSTPFLHVIHSPNEGGNFCQFEQRAVNLPNNNYLSVPNFPYYHLGPLDGSTCDTLGLNNPTAVYQPPPQEPTPKPQIQVWPNPTSGPLTLQYSNLPSGSTYGLYDVNGRMVQKGNLPMGIGRVYLSTEGLPAGVYLLRTVLEDGVVLKAVKVLVE